MSEEKRYNGRVGERAVRENHLDFLYELYKTDVAIGSDNIRLLKEKGYIKEKDSVVKIPNFESPFINEHSLKTTTEEQRKIDSKIDILHEGQSEPSLFITDIELDERRDRGGYVFEGRTLQIQKNEWLPTSKTNHEKDFIEWIDSINTLEFKYKKHYRKFTLYVQQCYTWLQENKTSSDFYSEEDMEAFRDEETRRCAENSLYFLNRYGYYKEGDVASGKVKYVASPVHEVMAYLWDCGYSLGIAKGRQIAATTTFMLLNVKDVVFRRNHFMKFITEDELKAEEIFEDKLKYAFSELPFWMKPNVLNERDNLFKLGEKEEKGDRDGVNSTIRVVAPKRTAIAGGAPNKAIIDEAGNIPILSLMLNNQRPTMFAPNPITKKLEITRQIIYFGTGGEMEKGGKSFEIEIMGLMKQWKERNFASAIVPLFFDWTCRPGATQEIYDNEKSVAYSIEGEDGKKKRTEFHQSWPNSLADVFRTSAKTLIDDEDIEKNLSRIRKARSESKTGIYQRGYFEPIFDPTKPIDNEGSDVEFKIISANFVPTEDIDPRASVTIFLHPLEGWKNRYFQGTDPIDTDTGLSNFASAVWDKYYKTIVAVVDYRTRNVKESFMQGMLLGLYYDTKIVKRSISELVESNRGTSYTHYKENKAFSDEMVLNFQLPFYLQNNTTINEGVGIDNKGLRNTVIINRMNEMLTTYGQKIYLPVVFEQLKTFVCNVSERGKEMWGPMNKKHFKDDVLFACTFAYICAELCFPELIPEDVEKEAQKEKKVTYQTSYDANWNLVRVPIRK